MDTDKAKYTLPDGSTLDVSKTKWWYCLVTLFRKNNFSFKLFFVAWPIKISSARTVI